METKHVRCWNCGNDMEVYLGDEKIAKSPEKEEAQASD